MPLDVAWRAIYLGQLSPVVAQHSQVTAAIGSRFGSPNSSSVASDGRQNSTVPLHGAHVRGHEKVPVCGRVEVPAGGRLKSNSSFVVSAGSVSPGR